MGRPTVVKPTVLCVNCLQPFQLRYNYQVIAYNHHKSVFCSTRCSNRFKGKYGLGIRRRGSPAKLLKRVQMRNDGAYALCKRAAMLWQTGMLNYAEIARALRIGNMRAERGRYYVRKGMAILREEGASPDAPATMVLYQRTG